MDNKMIEFLLSRRSIRRFKSDEIEEELIREILDVARWAPSGGNRQPWKFIVIRDRSRLNRLSECSTGAKPLREARAAIAVVVDPKVSPGTHLLDGANATLYILLAAHALGLGGVWIHALGNQGMREVLDVPDDQELVSLVALGWPAEDPKPRPRKQLEELVFFERYGGKG